MQRFKAIKYITKSTADWTDFVRSVDVTRSPCSVTEKGYAVVNGNMLYQLELSATVQKKNIKV